MVILNALRLKNNFLLAAFEKSKNMGGHFQPLFVTRSSSTSTGTSSTIFTLVYLIK